MTPRLAVRPVEPAPLAKQAPEKAILSLTTDLPCIVTLDNVELGRLRRDASETFLAEPGRHVLGAVETDNQRTWARVVELGARESTGVSIRFVPELEEEGARFRPESPAIEFVRIPPGEFWMGSGEPDAPRHRVRIATPFEMGRRPVTQEQWTRVIRRNPTPWDLQNNGRPVVNVSWEDTQEFLRRLASLDARGVYRLPTEAEWEYACRAGQDGAALPLLKTNPMGLGARALVDPTEAPNGFGLLGMRGFVSEWCQDWFDAGYYERSPAADPTGPPSGSAKVFRGGAFATNSEGMKPSERGSFPVTERTTGIGFRVVRVSR